MNRIDRELIDAARENNLPEVRQLLSVGADINTTDDDGETPLHWACYNSHVAVVNELLSRGPNIEAKNNSGNTPLHYACVEDHLPVVKALLAVGANTLAANNNGRLPVHIAMSRRKPEVSKYLLQQLYATARRLPLHQLVEDLTWIGSPRVGVPPLRSALDQKVLGMHDVVEVLEFLVNQNPTLLSSRDRDGSLPLHVACRRGASFVIVQSLVNRNGVSVKSVTPQGDLPLFLACTKLKPSLDTIFLLVKQNPMFDVIYR
jgi:ankyrin repeat protein